MWRILPLIGLALGVFAGQHIGIEIPAEMVKYLSIAILAALDSVLGGVRSAYENKYESVMMLTGFFANALLAAGLAYVGDVIGLDLYYAAVFAFGVRLFNNLSTIRHYIITNFREKQRLYEAHKRVKEKLRIEIIEDEPGLPAEPDQETSYQLIEDEEE